MVSERSRAMERRVLPDFMRDIISSMAEENSSSFADIVLDLLLLLLLLLFLEVPGRRRISRSSLYAVLGGGWGGMGGVGLIRVVG